MICELTADTLKDVNKANEPFDLIGRLRPAYKDGVWSHTEELFDVPVQKKYPDDDEDFPAYIGNENKTMYLFYEKGVCKGQIRVRANWNGYCFIEDIAVSADARGRGAGTRLMDCARRWAEGKGLKGFMLETQDTNVWACRFYIKQGFHIGAVDTHIYKCLGKPYCDENAIFWYMLF